MSAELIVKAKAAFRKNFLPGVVLWCFGIFLILGYFYMPSIRSALDWMAGLKETYGFLFSFIGMGFFAGLIPAIISLTTERIPKHRKFRDTLFYTIFWGYKGVEIDLLYRLQTIMFGTGSNFQTLTLKMGVDQFLYMPLISMIPLLILYRWKDSDYRLSILTVQVKSNDFWKQVPLVIFSCWIVWIPVVYIIYWFPASLQLAICNLIECFWALMLIVLTDSKNNELN